MGREPTEAEKLAELQFQATRNFLRQTAPLARINDMDLRILMMFLRRMWGVRDPYERRSGWGQ